MVRLKIQKSKGSIIYSMDDLLNFFFRISDDFDRQEKGRKKRERKRMSSGSLINDTR